MRIRTLAIAALLILALTAAPATAASSRSDNRKYDTWAGQVLRHQHHFDYQGSACPTSAEACIEILATYRIVPVTGQAAVGLRRAAGGPAKLYGYHAPASGGEHTGVLYVRRVKKT